jgi:hypothetical protein
MPEYFREHEKIKEHLKMFRNIRRNIIDNGNKGVTDLVLNPLGEDKTGRINSSRKRLKKWGTSFTKEEIELISKLDEKEEEERKKNPLSYKKILKTFMIDTYTDLRKTIMVECIVNNPNFQEEDFEKFLFYIEEFVSLFSGIQCKYFIDELGFINMDFYASEAILQTIAEITHYKLQFKIMNKAEVIKDTKEEKKVNPSKILYLYQTRKRVKISNYQ